MAGGIIILFVLIGINAFFAASEIALISLNDNKIKMMAEEGDKKAIQLVRLLKEPSRFLATIQIGITLAGFLASAFAAESFADPLVNYIEKFEPPLSYGALKAITVVVITLVLSYFTLVLGELVPKRVAMKKFEKISFFAAAPLTLLSRVTKPFVRFLSFSTNFIVRILGMDPYAEDKSVTEEEIRMLVDVGEEKGAILEHERIMINNIFEFNNKTAADIMTHRMELVSVPVSIGAEELMQLINREKRTRIPVNEENIDNIVGIFNVKDLIPYISGGERGEFELADNIRKPFFIPMQKKIDEVFVDMQLARTHMAIVIDEYGGTAGILTMEDLVEEIVGNIFDEYDKAEPEIMEIEKDVYEVSGLVTLLELEEFLEVELPDEEYDTLSGFLIGLIGGFPPEGEISEVRYNDLRIQITQVTEKRIEKAIIYVMEPGGNDPGSLAEKKANGEKMP